MSQRSWHGLICDSTRVCDKYRLPGSTEDEDALLMWRKPFDNPKKEALHIRLAELAALFAAKTKEPGTTREGLWAIAREHAELWKEFESID